MDEQDVRRADPVELEDEVRGQVGRGDEPADRSTPAPTVNGGCVTQPASAAGSVPLNGVTVTAASRRPEAAWCTMFCRASRRLAGLAVDDLRLVGGQEALANRRERDEPNRLRGVETGDAEAVHPPTRLRVSTLTTDRVSRDARAARAQPSAAESFTFPASVVARVSEEET